MLGVGLACAAGLVLAPVPASGQPAAGCARPSEAASAEVPPAQQQLAFERAWDLSRGFGVVVAVLDTGVDAGVPQLAGRVTAGPNLVPDGQAADTDCASHGTFLAGLVAAAPAPGSGFVGVAPEAQVLSVRYRDGRERGFTGSVGAALRAAVDVGAEVVLLGAPMDLAAPGLLDALAAAADRDVLVVTPGFELPFDTDPLTVLPVNVVSVTAVGPVPDGALAVSGPFELAAPAVSVTSVSRVSGGAVLGSGLEMAAAYAAGTAALVRSYRPQLTAVQIKQRLLATAVPATESTAPRVLDPLGAVANVLAAPGAAAPADRTPVEGRQPPVDDGTTTRAMLFVAVTLALTLAGGIGAATLRARRRRVRSS